MKKSLDPHSSLVKPPRREAGNTMTLRSSIGSFLEDTVTHMPLIIIILKTTRAIGIEKKENGMAQSVSSISGTTT